MRDKWDVRLTPAGTGSLKLNLPVALSYPMVEAGFNRAVITITDEGILISPYNGEGKDQSREIVELPKSWGGDV